MDGGALRKAFALPGSSDTASEAAVHAECRVLLHNIACGADTAMSMSCAAACQHNLSRTEGGGGVVGAYLGQRVKQVALLCLLLLLLLRSHGRA